MNTREHLESYIHKTSVELEKLKSISWPENRNALNRRMTSLENLLETATFELNHTNRG
jgi:hypothetical protein